MESIREVNEYNDELVKAIIKRDELIYSMLHGLSFSFPTFMVDDTIGIDKLRELFKTDDVISHIIAKKRIEKLHTDIFKI